MANKCEICGRGTNFGQSVTRRGKAKYLGGVGRNVTGISKRTFKVNVQKVRAVIDGSVKKIGVCTKCIKSGKLVKP